MLTTHGHARSRASAYALLVAVLVLPAVLVGLLRATGFDPLFESVTFHLFVVSGIAACALAVGAVAARAAARAARNHLEPLAIGCLAVGVLMLGHGLTTPGVFGRPFGLWVVRLPVLAIAAFAVCLWLVHRSPTTRRPPERVARRLLLASLLLALPVIAVAVDPTLLGDPVPGEGVARDLVAVAAGLLLLVTGRIHWQRWRLSGSRIQLALTLAAWLSTAALLSLQLGDMWRVSWWDYHVFLLAGFGAAVTAIVLVRRATRTVDDLLDDAFDADPFVHIVSGYPEALRALVAAVEVKDRYTHGHSARVAELAVRLGVELGLAPEQLRGLARGAYLHDVGKIGIPDHILNKPGRLDDAERAWIEQHPATGAQMAAGSPSLVEALGVIRHHHERYDGAGYPDGLAGDAIPLAARICAVADVWDALTSQRSYRAAMPPAEALHHLVSGAGTHFDPAVVEALVHHVRSDGALAPAARAAGDDQGTDEVVAAAAEACHHQPATSGAHP